MSVITGIALSSAILVCTVLITGPLVSCGPVDFHKQSAYTAPDIIVENVSDMIEYYAGDEDGTVLNTGMITSYDICAVSNDETAGTVTYETGFSEGGQTIYAEAVPKEGYVLDHWMVNGEEATTLGNELSIQINDITEDMNLVAVFTAYSYIAKNSTTPNVALFGAPSGDPVRSSPPGQEPKGAYVISTGAKTQQRDGSYVESNDGGTVSGGLSSGITTPTQINAIAKPGYVFDHWDINIIYSGDSSGESESYIETSNPVTIYLDRDSYTSATATCIAYFNIKNVVISLASMSPDQDAGTVTYNGVTLNVGDDPKPFAAGGRITVASYQGYYVDNVSFTDSLGVMHTYRPDSPNQTDFFFIIPEDSCKDDIYLHAEFTKNKYIVKVIDDPPEYGSSQILETTLMEPKSDLLLNRRR